VQEEIGQHEEIRKVRVQVDDLKRRALIRMADARDLQEQMRQITARLGSTIANVGRHELDAQKPE
jgi:hypothetical protein